MFVFEVRRLEHLGCKEGSASLARYPVAVGITASSRSYIFQAVNESSPLTYSDLQVK